MPITFLCPICEATLTAQDAEAGGHLTCAECATVCVVPRSEPNGEFGRIPDDYATLADCPHCRAMLRGGAVLCVNCGYHLLGREFITAAGSPSPAVSASQPAHPYAEFQGTENPPTNYRDAALFDPGQEPRKPATRFSLSEEELEWASEQVRIPGWGMMACGYGVAGLWTVLFFYLLFAGIFPLLLFAFFLVSFFVIGSNYLIGRGGQSMVGLENYSSAMTACMLSLLCGNFFALPFAIWSIIVLHNPTVKEAFGN